MRSTRCTSLFPPYKETILSFAVFLKITIMILFFQVGYMLHDRVLRPAEVGVTEGGPTEEEPEEKSS